MFVIVPVVPLKVPKGKRGPRGSSERLETQLKFFVDKARFRTKAEALAAVRQARERFVESGEETPGVRIVGRWRNPDNAKGIHARWKTTEDPGYSLAGMAATLRGALRAAADRAPRPRFTVEPSTRLAPSIHLVRSEAMRRYHAAVREIQIRHAIRGHFKSYAWARKQYRRLKK